MFNPVVFPGLFSFRDKTHSNFVFLFELSDRDRNQVSWRVSESERGKSGTKRKLSEAQRTKVERVMGVKWKMEIKLEWVLSRKQKIEYEKMTGLNMRYKASSYNFFWLNKGIVAVAEEFDILCVRWSGSCRFLEILLFRHFGLDWLKFLLQLIQLSVKSSFSLLNAFTLSLSLLNAFTLPPSDAIRLFTNNSFSSLESQTMLRIAA